MCCFILFFVNNLSIGGSVEECTFKDDNNRRTPVCEDDKRPFVGMVFAAVEEGYEFYKRYASNCGFDILCGNECKRSDDHTTLRKHFYCTKSGEFYLHSYMKVLMLLLHRIIFVIGKKSIVLRDVTLSGEQNVCIKFRVCPSIKFTFWVHHGYINSQR